MRMRSGLTEFSVRALLVYPVRLLLELGVAVWVTASAVRRAGANEFTPRRCLLSVFP